MTKATNKGTCQCCGSVQKLPNGVLSKHGYTTRWGFFSGVCVGAGSLPYEQSCDLIEQFIVNAYAHIENLKKENIELSKPATDADVENGFMADFYSKREYKYVIHRVKTYEDGGNFYIKDGKDEIYCVSRISGVYFKSTLDVANYYRKNSVKRNERTIKQLEQYIEWQKERVANWKPQELLPL